MGLLRLILALSVVLWHIPIRPYPFVIFNGGIAVQTFFIISGFYMAFVINEKYSRSTNGWIGTFYYSRLLRLAPAYLIVCLVEALWYWKTETPSIFTSNDLTIQARITLLFINIFIIGQDMWQTIFTHASTNIPNRFISDMVSFFGLNAFEPIYIYIGQAWSLGIEIIFYLIAPFLLLSRRRVLVTFFVLLLLRLYFIQHADIFPNDPWRSRFFPCNLPVFLFGVVGYWIYAKVINSRYTKEIGYAFLSVGILYILISLFYTGGVFIFNGPEDYDQPRLWVFYVLFSIAIPFIFILSKDNKWDRYIGEISYPVYLVHGFIIGFVFGQWPKWNTFSKMAIILFMTTIISVAIFTLIDRPIEKFRHKLFSLSAANQKVINHILSAATSASMVVLCLFSVLQPARKQTPLLVKVIEHYNIVKYNGLVYGVPHGYSVNWERDDLKNIVGITIADSIENVEKNITEKIIGSDSKKLV